MTAKTSGCLVLTRGQWKILHSLMEQPLQSTPDESVRRVCRIVQAFAKSASKEPEAPPLWSARQASGRPERMARPVTRLITKPRLGSTYFDVFTPIGWHRVEAESAEKAISCAREMYERDVQHEKDLRE